MNLSSCFTNTILNKLRITKWNQGVLATTPYQVFFNLNTCEKRFVTKLCQALNW